MSERAGPRVSPRLPVTLAILEPGGSESFGLVADISGGGACVLTFEDLDIGTSILCSLNFPNQPQPLGVAGQVVWAKREENIPSRFGVQFQLEEDRQSRLQALIGEVDPFSQASTQG